MTLYKIISFFSRIIRERQKKKKYDEKNINRVFFLVHFIIITRENLFLVCNTRIPTYITEINWKRGKSTRAATFPLLLMTTNDDYDDDDCYWLTPVCVRTYKQTYVRNSRKYTHQYKKISDSFIQNVNVLGCVEVHVIWYECLSFLFIIIIMLMISSIE